MFKGQTVFSQIMDFVPIKKFRRCVDRYNGNYRVRSFTCFDQYLCMAFAQLTYREVFAILNVVCGLCERSFTTWAFAAKSPAVQ